MGVFKKVEGDVIEEAKWWLTVTCKPASLTSLSIHKFQGTIRSYHRRLTQSYFSSRSPRHCHHSIPTSHNHLGFLIINTTTIYRTKLNKERELPKKTTTPFMTPEKALDVKEMKTGWWRTAETLLRVTSMGLCVVSLSVMLKNTQSNEYGSLSYSDLSGFQYIVYANGICLVYSLVSAFYFAVHRPLTLARAWAFFLLDQVHADDDLSGAHGGGAATETLFLAYRGNKDVAWSEACTEFDSFCGRAKTSVAITFGTTFCYIAISLLSSFRLFSTYEDPLPCLIGKSAGIAAFP